MQENFDFRNLFILDLANNHQGSVEHGLAIIRRHAEVVHRHGVRAAIKFQFRDLDSLIHPDYAPRSDNKHIQRFLETHLNTEDFQTLFEEVRRLGLYAMCTPFDEISAELIHQMGFDLVKIASCSARDWHLIEAATKTNRPMVFSTGGLEIRDIDRLVSFSEHRALDFALMHCVSIYPTPLEACSLQNIAMLRERYPRVSIGWSTHEDPDEAAPIQIAASYGAVVFERHIGLANATFGLNAYSSSPSQIERWFEAWKQAQGLAGSYERREPAEVETAALRSLQRGVFAKRPIKPGDQLERGDVFFAMPLQAHQLESGQFRDGIVAKHAIKANAPLMEEQIELPKPSEAEQLKQYIHQVRAILNLAGIHLGQEFYVEYSHHYGIPNFGKTGCVLIDCINRAYCKKILVQLPGQSHPYHFHRRKEETFQVLWGEMHLNIDGCEHTMLPGDTAVVLPGAWHGFHSDIGCVIEEISTTHHDDDSIYKDPAINNMLRADRKTVVKHWGRFEIS